MRKAVLLKLTCENQLEQILPVVGLEGLLLGRQSEQDAAHRPHVAALADRACLDDLRADLLVRSDERGTRTRSHVLLLVRAVQVLHEFLVALRVYHLGRAEVDQFKR